MLEGVGFSREQSEVSVKIATKQEMKVLEHRLTVRMGSMLAASIVLITTLSKFLHS